MPDVDSVTAQKEHVMLIVDSQIHIWKNGLPTNPAHRQIAVYSQDDAPGEMDAAGVDAAVLHPPG